jgi:HEAT repeat protein
MTSLTGLIVLVGSSLLLWLGLVGLAVTRKLRRDRRELRSVERRARNEATLRRGELAEVTALCDDVRGVAAQVDLAVSIDTAYPTLSAAQIAMVRRAMEASTLLPSLSAGLRSRRPTNRARAALLLTRPGVPALVERIVPLLGDPDPDVRLVACSGLARAATPRAAEVLIWALVARVLPPERIIERLGAPWAVETILTTLQEGPPPVVGVLAAAAPCGEVELDASLARALGIARDPSAANALATLLSSDSVEVRISAARALGKVGGAPCVPALIDALDSEDWPVRAQAAKSLGALGATDALGPLEDCLSDRAWWVRANAARALREFGEPGIEALRRTLEHDDRYAADRAREQLALHAVVQEHVTA